MRREDLEGLLEQTHDPNVKKRREAVLDILQVRLYQSCRSGAVLIAFFAQATGVVTGAAVMNHHPHPGPMQVTDDFRPDAAGATGDQSDLVVFP